MKHASIIVVDIPVMQTIQVTNVLKSLKFVCNSQFLQFIWEI